MRFVFMVMGEGLDCARDTAHLSNPFNDITLYGVSSVEMACEKARALVGRADLIELCGAFDDRMTRRVIQAVDGKIPVGHVTHFESENGKFERLFGKKAPAGPIRAYEPEDEERLMEIWLSANLEAHDFIPGSYWRENYDAVRQVYLPGSETYVYESEGEICGFISLLSGGFIGALFVDRSARCKGIGAELIGHCKALCSPLTVTVYTENKRAVSFYRRCGFKVTAEQPADSKGHTEYLMSWKREAPAPEGEQKK